jgi:hypothetical protein
MSAVVDSEGNVKGRLRDDLQSRLEAPEIPQHPPGQAAEDYLVPHEAVNMFLMTSR